jgi:hypothetical protein
MLFSFSCGQKSPEEIVCTILLRASKELFCYLTLSRHPDEVKDNVHFTPGTMAERLDFFILYLDGRTKKMRIYAITPRRETDGALAVRPAPCRSYPNCLATSN